MGSPNYINNFVDSPIIVNPETDEFFKQPMYYAIKHFSRFVERNSVRIESMETNDIKSIAFETPSKMIVVVLYNTYVYLICYENSFTIINLLFTSFVLGAPKVRILQL